MVSGWNLISSSGPISTPYSSLFLFLHLQSLDKGSAFTHQSCHPPILSWAAKVPCSPVSHSHWSRSMANADMFMAHHEALQREFMAHYEYIKRNSGLLKIIPCLGWATPLFGRNWKLSQYSGLLHSSQHGPSPFQLQMKYARDAGNLVHLRTVLVNPKTTRDTISTHVSHSREERCPLSARRH